MNTIIPFNQLSEQSKVLVQRVYDELIRLNDYIGVNNFDEIDFIDDKIECLFELLSIDECPEDVYVVDLNLDDKSVVFMPEH